MGELTFGGAGEEDKKFVWRRLLGEYSQVGKISKFLAGWRGLPPSLPVKKILYICIYVYINMQYIYHLYVYVCLYNIYDYINGCVYLFCPNRWHFFLGSLVLMLQFSFG